MCEMRVTFMPLNTEGCRNIC